MNKQISEFEEFTYKDFHITTDLGSAWFDGGVIHIEGVAVNNGEKHQVTVTVKPEDSPEFNNSISASEGELTKQDFNFTATLQGIENVEQKTQL